MFTDESISVFASEELSDDLAELGELLVGLPPEARTRAVAIYARVLDSNRKRRQLLSLVRDSISDMRLDLKYLEFDLTATCRERDQLQRQLELENRTDEQLGREIEGEIEGEIDDQ